MEIGELSSAGDTISSSAPQTLFEDEFENSRNNWELNAENDVASDISDGKLSITINTDQEELTAWTSPNITVSDFVLEVDTLYERGVGNHEYGVLIRKQDNNNFYQFAFSQNAFGIWKFEDSEWSKLQDWTNSDAIKKPGETNRLKIVARGDRFEFYANNELLATRNDDSFADGDIGLMVVIYDPGEAKVTFDNLVIYGEEGVISQKPTPTPRSISASTTDLPMSTPEPPTSTPRPDTGIRPIGRFAEIWNELGAANGKLGYPTSETLFEIPYARQFFQNGFAVWVDNPIDEHHFAINNGASYIIPDTWQEGMPEVSCNQTVAVRGFGKALCENAELRAAIGNPLGKEEGWPETSIIQEFQGGIMIYSPLDEKIVVFFYAGGWKLFDS